MANFNLTTQQIKDTYEQLAQVSASLLVDGTGSLSPIVTSSIIDFPTEVSRSAAAAGFGNTAGFVTETTFTTYTSSTDSKVNSLTAQTSSYALKTDISGAFTSTSASLAADIATNTTNIGINTSNIATNTSNISTQTSRVDSLEAATSSYAVVSSNNNFSGTQTFVNISVSGTASIGHVETITGSAVIIGDEFIILNAASPTARYAGLVVFDSGSTPATASFEWDGLTDNWIIMEETSNTAVVLTGPTGSRGAEVLPTVDRIQKGGGHHQLIDSNISDNGSQVSITGPVSASTYFGDGSNLTGISAGLVAGTGTDSIRSAAITSTQATASGNGAIAIGNATTAAGQNSVVIGNGLSNSGAEAVVIGNNILGNGGRNVMLGFNGGSNGSSTVNIGFEAFTQNNNAIAIGNQSECVGTNGITIGGPARSNGNNAIAIGIQADAAAANAIAIGPSVVVSTANGISIGDRFKFDGVSSIFLSGSVTSSGGFSGDGGGLTVSSGSSTGSFVDNIHPAIASSSAQIKHIVTLNQNQYTAITGSDDTLYIITDSSASVVTNLTITGELALSGSVSSEVTTLTIASSTASVDLSTSNFFEKSLTAATFIANPTNAKPGSTYTFKFDSGSLITNFDTDYRFPGGTNPTLSNGQDIVTFVSFVSGSAVKLYGTGLADFQ